MSMAALRRALAAFPELPSDVLMHHDHLPSRIDGTDFTLQLVFGDARATLPKWDAKADAWFLDGFSPAKNPEMWGADLMADVANHTATGGTFATYTAMGDVRRALAASGFVVDRVPGFGRKRHMTKGRLP